MKYSPWFLSDFFILSTSTADVWLSKAFPLIKRTDRIGKVRVLMEVGFICSHQHHWSVPRLTTMAQSWAWTNPKIQSPTSGEQERPRNTFNCAMSEKTQNPQMQNLGNLTGLLVTYSFNILVIRRKQDGERLHEKPTFKRSIICTNSWMKKKKLK